MKTFYKGVKIYVDEHSFWVTTTTGLRMYKTMEEAQEYIDSRSTLQLFDMRERSKQ